MVDITRGDIVSYPVQLNRGSLILFPENLDPVQHLCFLAPCLPKCIKLKVKVYSDALPSGRKNIAYPRGKTEIHPLLWSGISAVTPTDMNDRIDVLAEQIGIQAIWSVGGTWTRAA